MSDKKKKSVIDLVDIFNYDFEFYIKPGMPRLSTAIGAILSILSFLGIVLFLWVKIDSMLNYHATNFMYSKKDHYNDDSIVTEKMGFSVAFGLTAYDSSPDFIEDPDYVTLEVKYRSWGLSEST